MNKLFIGLLLIITALFGLVNLASAEKVNLWLAMSTAAVTEYQEKSGTHTPIDAALLDANGDTLIAVLFRGSQSGISGKQGVVSFTFDGQTYAVGETAISGDAQLTVTSSIDVDELEVIRYDFIRAAYSGPMDDATYSTLSKMKDGKVVRGMFPSVAAGGKTYNLFSLYLEGSARAKEAIDDMTAKWPGHFIIIGAWWMDGRQVGTQFNDEGVLNGTPTYPVHAQAYRFMQPENILDQNGDVTGTIPPTSNADLEDVNLLVGQSPRVFN